MYGTCAVKTFKKRVPRTRSPIIEHEGEFYFDLPFNLGMPVEVTAADIERLRGSTAQDGLLIARRVMGREKELLRQLKLSSEHETFGMLVSDGAERWDGRGKRGG